MTTKDLYCKGAKVWIAHAEKVWEGAELVENFAAAKKSLQVLTENGAQKTLTIKTEADLPPLRNPSILIGENDLTSLSYLHEPAVLYNLQVRFCQHKDIYTYCGIVLVAINPYDDLPIYGTDTIQTYRGQAMGDLDPHIFAVSEEAYTKLEREQRDQSIIVSGESGAGKTVSAKYAMRYFATVGGSATETQIEKKVLASSPIMEAIGNAKTTRNDNSSRFGKYIELQFNKQFHIIGASMRTYLLEKSRVVFQAPDERNYHIFYQICAARNKMPHLQLESVNSFHYLNQGSSPIISGVDDADVFEETTNALNLLGFSEQEQNDMFKILAAVLHIGNIDFLDMVIEQENEQDQEGCGIPANDKHLKMLAELLEIDLNEIRQWLCTRRIVSMREVFLKPMSVEQATVSRDALAKHIYAELFNWIVVVVNKALESNAPRHKFIGVLDIYGFETFEINSFEQFCINYANEKLQQQFNQHVFKLEQEEYIKEEIAWKMIDFYDNQPCIDLIETKLGILDLLDEECKMPKGSDGSWTEKLYSKCIKYQHFAKARFGTSAFVINHFADKVQYESTGFLEKNRDTVIEEQIAVIKHSKNPLVRSLFSEEPQKLAPPGAKLKIVSAKPLVNTQKTHKKTVGSQFRDSLNMLMATLNATTPHYVRCIKPNDEKEAFVYNPQRAVQQLRACGVLETIRISAAGFPSRWTYNDFFNRYRVLCRSSDITQNNMQKTCENILAKNIKQADQYQFGKTKIFFRAGQVAYLEKLRADKLKKCCIIIQSQIRAFIWRKKYLRIQKSVLNIQRYGRGVLARRLALSIRRTRAATTLQRYIRGWVKKTQYRRLQRLVKGFQRYSRGYLARRRYMEMKYNANAIIIQKHIRGWLARREYKRRTRYIVVCQSAIRRFLAKRHFRRLKAEARSVEHVKKLNKGLENKIISLQQKIDELNKDNNTMKIVQNEVVELKNKLSTFKALEIEIKKLNQLLMEKNRNIGALEEKLKAEQDEKMDLIQEQEKYKKDIEDERVHRAEETVKLRKELDNLNEIVQSNQKGAEEKLKLRLEQEKTLLINEQDQDRNAYQKLLQEYHCLEQHCEGLEQQLNDQQSRSGSGMHQRNASDVSGISTAEDGNLDVPEDYGYGSVRSNSSIASSQHGRLDGIEWKADVPAGAGDQEPKLDIGLVLKLQYKLGEVERERMRLQKRLDEIESSPRSEKAENQVLDSIRISELEVANNTLKSQISSLRESVCNGSEDKQLCEQFTEMQTELDRRREEIAQLRTVLANQTNHLRTMSTSGHKASYINEDGELALAYETQKTINKQLELELQDEKNRYRGHEKDFKFEIEKLREDNERQQRLLSANLAISQQNQNEQYMQHEISRLTTENLDLQEKNDEFNDLLRKYKRQVKLLSKKLKESGLLDCTADMDLVASSTANNAKPSRAMPHLIRRKDREYQGIFIFEKGEEAVIMKQLVMNLKPRTAVTLLPGLPAYIVFMCIRHTDMVNDEDKVRYLLTAFINSVKKLIKKRHEDFETCVLWLSNTLRLLHCLKQYSGDEAFQKQNTSKQNDQCLRNFDLSEYRQILSDNAVWIYQALICKLEEKIQPLIVPAILEHEEISGISGSKPSGLRGRTASVDSPGPVQKAPHVLLQELTSHHKILGFYGVDPDVISQIFKQLFYFLCASSLNNLLLRKELCHWSKGTQIRYNLSSLEMWTKDKQLDEAAINTTLNPILQAALLLQCRKKDEDVASVCEMCKNLTSLQIIKILNLYTPVDEYEQRVSVSFIKKIQSTLEERQEPKDQTLLMDIKQNFPVRFPFNPSSICLEDVEIPEVLMLQMLEKI